MAWWASDTELLTELRGLRKEIAELLVRRGVLKREVDLSDEVVRLKTEISDLKIDKGRREEKHAADERELRHMIGLEKKRQEFEVTAAKRESIVAVREENLAADKQRFADEMKFQRERFTEEVGYLKSMVGEVLERLPSVNVALEGTAGRKK